MPVPANLPSLDLADVWGAQLNDAIKSLHLGPGTHASLPAPDAVPEGSLYSCTDHSVIHRTNGTTWSDYAIVGGSGGGASAPTLPLDSGTKSDPMSTALPGGWLGAGYTSADYIFSDDYLHVTTGRAAGNYFYRAVPAGDWTATMKSYAYSNGSNVMFGIVAFDDTGAGVGAGWYNSSPDAVLMGTCASGVYNSSANVSIGAGIKGSQVNNGTPAWYRLRKVGGAYYHSMSLNGLRWGIETAAFTPSAFTPTRLGFGAFYNTINLFGVDWFSVA